MSNLVVVKIGGALLEKAEAAVDKIISLRQAGLVIVHGGGIQITRMLERMDVKSKFIDGLRVTDDVTLNAVAASLLGEVHTALVRSRQRSGQGRKKERALGPGWNERQGGSQSPRSFNQQR